VLVKLTDTLDLSAGARYTKETSTGYVVQPYVHTFLQGVFLQGVRVPGGFSGHNTSPEATLRWQPTNDVMVYGSYKQGFKSGGMNVSQLLTVGFDPAQLNYKDEIAKGYEVGLKSRMLDDTLQANFTLYRYAYSNLQVSLFNSQTLAINVLNAGEFVTKGAEFQLDYKPPSIAGLSVRSDLNYNSAEYQQFLGQCYTGESIAQGCNQNFVPAVGAYTAQNLAGRQKRNAPRFAGNLGLSYEHPLGIAKLHYGISTDWSYSSSYYLADTLSPFQTQDGYFSGNAAFKIFSDDNRWDVSLIGTNITNKIALTGIQDRPFTGSGTGTNSTKLADTFATANRPREVAIQYTARF
jgi:outer membrane receptor protein involved in Fe transport